MSGGHNGCNRYTIVHPTRDDVPHTRGAPGKIHALFVEELAHPCRKDAFSWHQCRGPLRLPSWFDFIVCLYWYSGLILFGYQMIDCVLSDQNWSLVSSDHYGVSRYRKSKLKYGYTSSIVEIEKIAFFFWRFCFEHLRIQSGCEDSDSLLARRKKTVRTCNHADTFQYAL